MRVFALIVLSSAVASAQPADPPAIALFKEGLALMDEQKPAEACAKFEASLKIEPDAAGPMLNLGLCNEQLDRFASALRWFRRVQTRAAELHIPDAENAAKDKTTALAPKVPTLKVTVGERAPAGAGVTVDGRRLEDFELARYEVDAGHHVVDLVAGDGARKDRQELDIADGESKTVELGRPPPPPAAKPAPAPVVHGPLVVVDRGAGQRRWAYIVGGAGAALWLTDGVLLTIAKHQYDATERPDTRQSWQNFARYGGTSIFIVGAGAIAAGAWLYLRAPGPERVEQTVVAPTVDRGHVGLAVTGAF